MTSAACLCDVARNVLPPSQRRRPNVRGTSLVASATAAALFCVAACVDLFHSTEFETLCMVEAGACIDAGGLAADAAAAPPLDFCDWSGAEARAHAERACAWLGACHGALQQSSFGKCMIRALAAYDCALNPSLRPQGQTRALWSCLAHVTSCSEVGACVFGTVPTCRLESSTGTFTTCTADGFTVVECGPGLRPPVAVEPCLLEGRRCTAVNESTALCAGDLRLACSGNARCEGTHAIECKSTSDMGIDCAAFGAARCVKDDAGVACAPVEGAPTCAESSTIRCDGSVARRCVGGQEIAIDCARMSQPCSASMPNAIDPLSACTNLDAGTRCAGGDECSGDVLRSCEQGKMFELSCSKVGLGGCVKSPPGRGAVATCTKP